MSNRTCKTQSAKRSAPIMKGAKLNTTESKGSRANTKSKKVKPLVARSSPAQSTQESFVPVIKLML